MRNFPVIVLVLDSNLKATYVLCFSRDTDSSEDEILPLFIFNIRRSSGVV